MLDIEYFDLEHVAGPGAFDGDGSSEVVTDELGLAQVFARRLRRETPSRVVQAVERNDVVRLDAEGRGQGVFHDVCSAAS